MNYYLIRFKVKDFSQSEQDEIMLVKEATFDMAKRSIKQRYHTANAFENLTILDGNSNNEKND